MESDGGAIIVQHSRTAGGIGQGQALDAHAESQGGFRNGPVDISALHFHGHAVSAHGTAGTLAFSALASAAPGGVADFKVHGVGKGFGSDSVQLQTDTLGSGEAVAAVSLLLAVGRSAGLVNEVALTAGEADEPLALSLEINSTGAGGRAEHEAGCEKECHKFFHEWFPSYKNCVILVRNSNV